jgi:hypothetical protein
MRVQSVLFGLCFSLVGTNAMAEGSWKLLPAGDATFKPEVTVSALVGSMNPKDTSSGSFTGAEVAFNCLLIQPPSGVIRSKISVGQYDHGGLKLTSYELNPRWTFNLDKDLSIGFGPGIGYVDAKAGGNSKGMWASQIGADLDYRIGKLNLGLATRWQGMQSRQIAAGYKGADNVLVEAKIGMNF